MATKWEDNRAGGQYGQPACHGAQNLPQSACEPTWRLASDARSTTPPELHTGRSDAAGSTQVGKGRGHGWARPRPSSRRLRQRRPHAPPPPSRARACWKAKKVPPAHHERKRGAAAEAMPAARAACPTGCARLWWGSLAGRSCLEWCSSLGSRRRLRLSRAFCGRGERQQSWLQGEGGVCRKGSWRFSFANTRGRGRRWAAISGGSGAVRELRAPSRYPLAHARAPLAWQLMLWGAYGRAGDSSGRRYGRAGGPHHPARQPGLIILRV
jgi:hypothetical protein